MTRRVSLATNASTSSAFGVLAQKAWQVARVQAEPEVLLGEPGKLALAYPGMSGQVKREISRAQDGPERRQSPDGDRGRVRRDLGEAEACSDRGLQLWPLRRVRQLEQSQDLRRLHCHPGDGPCGPGRAGGVAGSTSSPSLSSGASPGGCRDAAAGCRLRGTGSRPGPGRATRNPGRRSRLAPRWSVTQPIPANSRAATPNRDLCARAGSPRSRSGAAARRRRPR